MYGLKFGVIDIETRVVGDKPSIYDIPKFIGFRAENGRKVMYRPNEISKIKQTLNYFDVLIGHNMIGDPTNPFMEGYDIPILRKWGFEEDFYTKTKKGREYAKHIHVDTQRISEKRLKSMLYLDFGIHQMGLGNLCKEFDLPFQKGEIDYNIFKKNDWTPAEIEEIRKYLYGDLDSTWALFMHYHDLFIGFKDMMSQKDQNKLSWLRTSSGSNAYKIICNQTGLEETYARGKDNSDDGVQYEGAFVALPYKDFVEGKLYCVDWASLYPHMYMLGNLYSRVEQGTPGAWHGGKIFVSEEQNPDGDHITGWYKRIPGKIETTLKNLYDKRTHAKQQMEKCEEGSDEYKKWDATQLATKITLNTCFSSDTEILTVEGIKNIRDVKVGDDVYSINKETGFTEIKPITELQWFNHNGKMIHFKSDQYDLLVTPDHDMVITTRKTDDIKTVKADDVPRFCYFPRHIGFKESGGFVDREYFLWYIRGMYLADGYIRQNKTKNGKPNGWTFSISKYKNVYPEVYQRIEWALRKLTMYDGIKFRKHDKGFDIYNKKFCHKMLEFCGVSDDKRIKIFPNSYSNMEALFSGMYDGDGSKGSVKQYSTKLIGLRDDFIQLSTMLGYKWQYRFDSGLHRIGLRPKNTKTSIRGRNISTEEYDGTVHCVTVEDNHTVLVGRNGKFEWCGQCYGISGSSIFEKVFDLTTASDCTAMARMSIKHARTELMKEGYECMYTDSVTGDSNFVFKHNDVYNEMSFTDFHNYVIENVDYEFEGDEEQCRFHLKDEVLTLSMTDDLKIDWKPVKYLYAHWTDKKCYELISKDGKKLTVTEDHSLMDVVKGKLAEVKPTEAKRFIINDGRPDKYIRETWNYLAIFLGYWCVLGKMEKGGVIKMFKRGRENRNKAFEAFIAPQLKDKFRVYSRVEDGVIIINSVKLQNWMREYGFMKRGEIPPYVFDQNNEFLASFLRGMYTAMSFKGEGFAFFSRNLQMLDDVNTMLERLGLKPTFSRKSKKGDYIVYIRSRDNEYFKKNIASFDPSTVYMTMRGKKDSRLSYSYEMIRSKTPLQAVERYVYDVEVEETHNFFANDVLVHNTDSVYLLDPYDDPERLSKVCERISKEQIADANIQVDTHFLEIETPIKRMYFYRDDKGEFNKKFYTYVVPGKKEDEPDKPKHKGIKIVKGDCSPMAVDIVKKHIEPLMLKGKPVLIEPTVLFKWTMEAMREDPDSMKKRFRVRNPKYYENKHDYVKKPNGPTSIQYRVAQKYGEGEWYLYNNTAMGVGKTKMYTTKDELEEKFGDDWVTKLNLSAIVENLKNFIQWDGASKTLKNGTVRLVKRDTRIRNIQKKLTLTGRIEE